MDGRKLLEETLLVVVESDPLILERQNLVDLKFEEKNIVCSVTRNDDTDETKNASFNIYFDRQFQEHIHSTVQKQIISLCKPSIEIYILVDHNLCALPKIEHTTGIILGYADRIEGECVDNFFMNYPNSKVAIIHPIIDGEFKKSSNIFQVQHLSFWKTGLMASTIILNFNGQRAWLSDAICHNFAIVRFLTKWVFGEAYDDLEEIIMLIDFAHPIRPIPILREFDTQPWNPLRRPKDFVSKQFDNYTKDCSNARDIERKSDGKLASIIMSTTRFYFFVWN